MAETGELAQLLEANGYAMSGESPNQELLSKLPKKVKARVAALKKLQLDSIAIEAKFYERVHALEKEFEGDFGKIFEQRRKVISGEYEPTAEETTLPLLHGATEEEIKKMDDDSAPDAGEVGIPDFWLNTLKTSEGVQDMIQDHDEPILKHLVDITSTIELNPVGFTLYFHFAENPFFTDKVLTKKYELQLTPDEEDPFDYDGPSVTKSFGSDIHWKDGKNVTKKIIKKKQKKGANAGKFLTKTVKADSFFNFFETIEHASGDNKNEEDEDEETAELERADFEVGQIIRDHVVPRAVLFYTGEAADPDMFDGFDEGDEGDDDESETDDE